MEYKLNCAQLRQMAPRLHAGDRVLLSGRVYTSRDAAHKRIAVSYTHLTLPTILRV